MNTNALNNRDASNRSKRQTTTSVHTTTNNSSSTSPIEKDDPSENDDNANILSSSHPLQPSSMSHERMEQQQKQTQQQQQEEHGHQQGRVTRISMDGSMSISYVDDMNDPPPKRRMGNVKSKVKKKDLVVIQDPKLAKKLAKYMAKKERKRKRRERFRKEPIAISKQLSSDSLGDMSKSTIENLYGTVTVSMTPTRKRFSSMDGSINTRSKDEDNTNFDDGMDLDEASDVSLDARARSLSRSKSSENAELLQAAVTALEKYQMTFASSRSDSDDGITDTFNDICQQEGGNQDDNHFKRPIETDETASANPHLLSGLRKQEAAMCASTKTVPIERQTTIESQIDDKAAKQVTNTNIRRQTNKVTKKQTNQRISIDVSGHHGKAVSRELVNRVPIKEIDIIHTEQDCVSVDISLDPDLEDIEDPVDKQVYVRPDGENQEKHKLDANKLDLSKRTSSPTFTSRHLDDDCLIESDRDVPFGMQEKNNIDDERSRNKCKCWHSKLVCLTAIMVLSSSALVVWILLRTGIIDGAGSQEISPPIQPVDEFTSARPSSLTYTMVRNAIQLEFGDTTYNRLMDSRSPQAKAASWIANKDTFLSFPISDDPASKKEFRQRFTMATFFYATGGSKSWINQFSFLSPSHVCDWTRSDGDIGGVFCLENVVLGITLPGNGLEGTIPEEIWALEDLQVLELNGNFISGSISKDLLQLSGMHTLSLSGNPLGGSLPASLGLLFNLKSFAASNCGLLGRLPSELANTDMERLLLDGNQFTGTVPASYADLPLCKFILRRHP